MTTGRVLGTATATIKHASMAGSRLLIVQPQMADGCAADGEPVLAIDSCGASVGSRVVLTSDGRQTADLLGDASTPVRWSVLGIVDT